MDGEQHIQNQNSSSLDFWCPSKTVIIPVSPGYLTVSPQLTSCPTARRTFSLLPINCIITFHPFPQHQTRCEDDEHKQWPKRQKDKIHSYWSAFSLIANVFPVLLHPSIPVPLRAVFGFLFSGSSKPVEADPSFSKADEINNEDVKFDVTVISQSSYVSNSFCIVVLTLSLHYGWILISFAYRLQRLCYLRQWERRWTGYVDLQHPLSF